jgi:hypothetical protein
MRSSSRADTARAMSQENLERLRRGFERFMAIGDFLAEGLHADFVWDMSTFRGWPHRRSELYRTAGFAYLEQVDAWDCPEGERRVGTDLEARLARYRAPAHACNACPRKNECTDSDRGREVPGPWIPGRTRRPGTFTAGSPWRWSASGCW